MEVASGLAQGLPGALPGVDWFWLLEGRTLAFALAAMAAASVGLQLLRWRQKS